MLLRSRETAETPLMSTKTLIRKTLDIIGYRADISVAGAVMTVTFARGLSIATGHVSSDYPQSLAETNRKAARDALVAEAKRRGCKLVDVYARSRGESWQVDQLDIEPDAAEDIDEDTGT